MSEDGFLDRWSRRKRAAADPAPDAPPPAPRTEPAQTDTAQTDPTQTDHAAEESEAAFLARTGLPHPDDMPGDGDFAAFLRENAPAALRKLAMRRLWRSHPGFAVLDGLAEYDEDFTGGGVKEGLLATGWKIGEGFVRRAAATQEATEPEPEESKAEPAADAVPPSAGPPPEAPHAADPAPAISSPEPPRSAAAPAPPAVARRMAFRPVDDS